MWRPNRELSVQPGATVLITGASTGIGLALVRLLLEQGYRVAASARQSSLARFAELGLHRGERLLILPLDVTLAEERMRALDTVFATWQRLDVLVNNAGLCTRAVWEDLDEDSIAAQMAVNFSGPMALARALFPHWRARGGGRLINVSSVGGMMAMPTMGAYNASKFALEGASEALWYEGKPWNIRVSLLEPGFVHSESFRNALFTPASRTALQDENHPYHQVYGSMLSFIEKLMALSRSEPRHVARRILRLMRAANPPLRASGTPDALLFSLLRRFLPVRIYHGFLFRQLPHIRQRRIHDRPAK